MAALPFSNEVTQESYRSSLIYRGLGCHCRLQVLRLLSSASRSHRDGWSEAEDKEGTGRGSIEGKVGSELWKPRANAGVWLTVNRDCFGPCRRLISFKSNP